jgi:hypothetical protein
MSVTFINIPHLCCSILTGSYTANHSTTTHAFKGLLNVTIEVTVRLNHSLSTVLASMLLKNHKQHKKESVDIKANFYALTKAVYLVIPVLNS